MRPNTIDNFYPVYKAIRDTSVYFRDENGEAMVVELNGYEFDILNVRYLASFAPSEETQEEKVTETAPVATETAPVEDKTTETTDSAPVETNTAENANSDETTNEEVVQNTEEVNSEVTENTAEETQVSEETGELQAPQN